jgi:hypothetical protein
MAKVEERLSTLGLVLPPPVKAPAGVVLPFQFIRLVGNRAYISGHGPQSPDGSIAAPFGKLGREFRPNASAFGLRRKPRGFIRCGKLTKPLDEQPSPTRSATIPRLQGNLLCVVPALRHEEPPSRAHNPILETWPV